MGYLKRYWTAVRRAMMDDEETAKLFEERERLMEICIPYKIQAYESGYLEREDINNYRNKLVEIDRKLKRLS